MTTQFRHDSKYLVTLESPEYAAEIAALTTAFGHVELTPGSLLRCPAGPLSLVFSDAGFALPAHPPLSVTVAVYDLLGDEVAAADRCAGMAGAIETGHRLVDHHWRCARLAQYQRR